MLRWLLGRRSAQPLYQWLYRLALKGMNYGNASAYRENGELESLQAVARVLTRTSGPLVIFDVGANVGHYTTLLTRAFSGREVMLHAFEPSAPTFEKLKENCGRINGVQLHRLALSDREGTTQLFYEKETSGLSSLYQRDLAHRKIEMNVSETISLSTLDTFCAQHAITHIHFFKMDVEGHELSVLQGGQKVFDAGMVDVVQFEFGGCNIDSHTNFRDFYKFFAPRYQIYRILKNGLTPVGDYHERLEIYMSANYLAVRRELGAL